MYFRHFVKLRLYKYLPPQLSFIEFWASSPLYFRSMCQWLSPLLLLASALVKTVPPHIHTETKRSAQGSLSLHHCPAEIEFAILFLYLWGPTFLTWSEILIDCSLSDQYILGLEIHVRCLGYVTDSPKILKIVKMKEEQTNVWTEERWNENY